MDLLPVRAVLPPWDSENFQRKKKRLSTKDPPSQARSYDNKVMDIVLERINSNPKGSLLATASAPHVVLEFLSEFHVQKKEKRHSPLKEGKLFGPSFSKNSLRPLGIARCEYNRWINALMQFIIFIPSLSEMFAFTPKSLSPFIEFIDLYKKEQIQGKSVTTASSLKLLEVLRKKSQVGFFLNKSPFQLFMDLLQFLMQNVMPFHGMGQEQEESDLLAMHPEWMLPLDLKSNASWEEGIEKHFHLSGIFQKIESDPLYPFPKELLVFQKEQVEHLLCKRQFFLSHLNYW